MSTTIQRNMKYYMEGEDVGTMQFRLNASLSPSPNLDQDGKYGRKTEAAVIEFQRKNELNPDGIVGMLTLGKMKPLGEVFTDALHGNNGTGDFMSRLDRFIQHVRDTYNIIIIANSRGRTADWQHKMHVAHMIKFNSYNSLTPRNSQIVGGRRVIDFNHLSNAALRWAQNLDATDLLRDSLNQPCRRQVGGQGWENPPHEDNTRARALEILRTAGIGTPRNNAGTPIGPANSAQVAPGVQGCAEPCGCGGNRSRHVAGMAADLPSAEMDRLKLLLSPPTEAGVDELLSQFGLCRPVAGEPWHVEATR